MYQNTITFQTWRKPDNWKWKQTREWFLNQYEKPNLRGEWVPIRFHNTKTGKAWNVARVEKLDAQNRKRKVVNDYDIDGSIPAEEPRKRVRRKNEE
jgi:hypothetical protein